MISAKISLVLLLIAFMALAGVDAQWGCELLSLCYTLLSPPHSLFHFRNLERSDSHGFQGEDEATADMEEDMEDMEDVS